MNGEGTAVIHPGAVIADAAAYIDGHRLVDPDRNGVATARIDDLEIRVVGSRRDGMERAVQLAQWRGGKVEGTHRFQTFSFYAEVHVQAAFS